MDQQSGLVIIFILPQDHEYDSVGDDISKTSDILFHSTTQKLRTMSLAKPGALCTFIA